jgi:hypothetical protein
MSLACVERIIELIAAALPELEMRAVASPAEVWAKVDPFKQATLRLELNRIDPNDKEKRKKVNKLAEKLVECAIEDKQAWAFNLIADRLEGKAAQQIDHNVIDNREISEFSDAELSAMLRRRVGVAPVESEEERPEGEALN